MLLLHARKDIYSILMRYFISNESYLFNKLIICFFIKIHFKICNCHISVEKVREMGFYNENNTNFTMIATIRNNRKIPN